VLTVAAIDIHGIMDSNFEEAQVAREMVNRARRRIVVADHSKFGRMAAFKVCDLDGIDMLVADQPPAPDLRTALTAAGVEIR
jgi:DeoR family glycerol-3-phosphate regulon repressor